MNREDLLKILVCPNCQGKLSCYDAEDLNGFQCEKCRLIYPIRDDIPIMLIEEAIKKEEE